MNILCVFVQREQATENATQIFSSTDVYPDCKPVSLCFILRLNFYMRNTTQLPRVNSHLHKMKGLVNFQLSSFVKLLVSLSPP